MIESNGLAHLNPVWRERANFIIGALLPIEENSSARRWEQLWARQIDESLFELCCIPFFIYDLALGDKVETAPELGRSYVVQRVVERSGQWTYRVWFGDSNAPETLSEILGEIHELGCPMEFYSKNLLGVSAPTDHITESLNEILSEREGLGHLEYETGWSR